jgi:hypothetical protein
MNPMASPALTNTVLIMVDFSSAAQIPPNQS